MAAILNLFFGVNSKPTPSYPGTRSEYYTLDTWNENLPIMPGGYRSCAFYTDDENATVESFELIGNANTLQKACIVVKEIFQKEFNEFLTCKGIRYIKNEHFLTVLGATGIYNVSVLFLNHNELVNAKSKKEFKSVFGIKIKDP